MEQERRLTNQEHIDLWDQEVEEWTEDQRIARGSRAMLLFTFLVTIAAGLGILISGINLLS